MTGVFSFLTYSQLPSLPCLTRVDLNLFIWSGGIWKLVTRAQFLSLLSASAFLEGVELLISRLGSVAAVIIFLRMLEFGREPKKGGEKRRGKGEKPAAVTTISTHLLQVIYSSHPPNTTSTTSPSTSQLNAPLPSRARSPSLSSCLSLHPRRQSGQAVFTAEVIGVVWREPDPGPAKAKDMCACAFFCLRLCVPVRILCCTYACLWWLAVRPGKESRP